VEIAVAVIAYDRPYYFRDVVKSLSENPESAAWPHFFFLDGGPQATIDENKEIINASSIKNRIIIERQDNYGCGRNLIDVRRYLFDEKGFDLAFIIEDDLVLAPTYFTVAMRLLEWAQKKYDNVGIVQCWSKCTLDESSKRGRLAEVKLTQDHLYGYAIHRAAWDAIKTFMYYYEGIFVSVRPTPSCIACYDPP
jgi:Glycosyltransferase like family 2